MALPTTEYEGYLVRVFLRPAFPEAPAEVWYGVEVNGRDLNAGWADPDVALKNGVDHAQYLIARRLGGTGPRMELAEEVREMETEPRPEDEPKPPEPEPSPPTPEPEVEPEPEKPTEEPEKPVEEPAEP